MRKYLWSGAATVPLLLLGLYGAAGYAGRHPDSFLARVAVAAYHASFSPGSSCGNHDCAGACNSDSGENSLEAAPCTPAEPELLSGFLPAHPLPAEGTSEPIHVEPAVPSSPPLELNRARFVEIIPGVVDGADDCPNVMPRCYDETEAPPLMPSLPGLGGCLDETCLDAHGLYWLDLPAGNAASEGVKEIKSDKCDGCPQCPGCCEKKEPTKKSGNPEAKREAGQEEQESSARTVSQKVPVEDVNKQLQRLLERYQSPDTRPAQRRVDTMEFRPSDARRGEFDPIPF